jgi:endonuclease/exonuclease/phosphatase family metal-dependent hydrolase
LGLGVFVRNGREFDKLNLDRGVALPSTKFLFWNINGKPLADLIADLTHAHGVDLVILAESKITVVDLLLALNRQPTAGFHFCAGLSNAITIYSSFSSAFLTPVFESERVSIRRLTLPARSELLLATVHFPSKLYWSNDSQAFECAELARRISIEEDKLGHRRTVLVGDFNMDPFETGMVAAAGLNSVMSRGIAAREVRTVQGRDYRLFYNPMWGHFGDARSPTAGSYYYDSAQHVNYFWHMFDQVLIRPELAERFDSSHVKIVRSLASRSLVRPDGRPDTVAYSDHLPVIFELDF